MTARIIERGKTSGRSDDNMQALVKRFDTYLTQSLPVIQHFDALGLVRKVDAAGSIDEVYAQTRRLFLPKKFVFVLGGPGCGKGTNCTRLKEEMGFVHLVNFAWETIDQKCCTRVLFHCSLQQSNCDFCRHNFAFFYGLRNHRAHLATRALLFSAQ